MADGNQLSLLGPVQVSRDGAVVRGFESRKALALLCYLAVRGQVISRSHLADLFWPDKPAPRGRGNLSRVLHNLTTLLPGCVQTTRETVAWAPAGVCRLDLTDFVGLVARADLASLAAAVALYRGDLMSNLYLDECAEFETWLAAEQELWRQRMAQALDLTITLQRDAGNYRESLRYAAQLVALDSWREESHRTLMLLLALGGQRSAALKQYVTCRHILARELDVAPAEATTRLYEHILAEEIRVRQPTGGLVPAPVPTSRRQPARAGDLVQIIDRLEQPECRLLSLVGPDTRAMAELGKQVAARQAHQFRDGICLVDAMKNTGRTNVAGALANALQLSGRGSVLLPGAIYGHLRDREMLLFFPTFHSRPPNTGLLEDILKRAPHVKIMLATHEPVNSYAEWIYDVFPANAR